MAAWKVGPSLAAGCTIVLKPSEFTPFSVLELAGRMGRPGSCRRGCAAQTDHSAPPAAAAAAAEAVGLPAGVLNIVNGPGALGAHLVHHPKVDKVSFTGR